MKKEQIHVVPVWGSFIILLLFGILIVYANLRSHSQEFGDNVLEGEQGEVSHGQFRKLQLEAARKQCGELLDKEISDISLQIIFKNENEALLYKNEIDTYFFITEIENKISEADILIPEGRMVNSAYFQQVAGGDVPR